VRYFSAADNATVDDCRTNVGISWTCASGMCSKSWLGTSTCQEAPISINGAP
jgi:hypothetical protein